MSLRKSAVVEMGQVYHDNSDEGQVGTTTKPLRSMDGSSDAGEGSSSSSIVVHEQGAACWMDIEWLHARIADLEADDDAFMDNNVHLEVQLASMSSEISNLEQKLHENYLSFVTE